ncbi:uncharacterized protein LOC121864449 isoform X3 [Homarus americanus]|uniref:uncharacterized protein LOC121864449 isoform X3 n=1 Tax=Homarus americanus TaxID=6706 RepID=UPI001C43C149|nr:uncharacterized protein LOC121864449 isoform X3 [Homarus americanus]
MQSMASLMSMNTPNDIAPLEDFDDEDDNEGRCYSEPASRVSTLRRKGRSSTLTSPGSPGDAMVRSAEFSQLAAQISSLTSSFHQDDPLAFSFSDSHSPLNAFDETEEDAATLEGGEEQAHALSTDGDPSSTNITSSSNTYHQSEGREGGATGTADSATTATTSATTASPTSDQHTSVQEG